MGALAEMQVLYLSGNPVIAAAWQVMLLTGARPGCRVAMR